MPVANLARCATFRSGPTPLLELPAFPGDFLKRFTGAPVTLFAAGKDDYDDRDPGACKEFVGTVDEKYRGAFQIVSYPEATHGWNQRSQSFFSETACKGRGCMNRNVFDSGVTEANTADVVRFFSAKLNLQVDTAPGRGSREICRIVVRKGWCVDLFRSKRTGAPPLLLLPATRALPQQ